MICEKCGKEFFEDWRKDHRSRKTPCRFCSISCSRVREHSEETKEKISNSVKKNYPRKKTHSYRRLFTKEEREKGNLKQKQEAEKRNRDLFNSDKYEKISYKSLRKLLLEEKNNTCEVCGNSVWLDEPLWLEIHHKDDNNKNNKKENLIVVCPNCHSVLDKNYRFRGRKHKN